MGEVAKYKVYDRVWVMQNNRPTQLLVFAVVESMDDGKRGTEIFYRLVNATVGTGWGNNEGIPFFDVAMFPTREALIESLSKA